jgi:hypothetical protein
MKPEDDLDAMLDSTLEDFLKTVDPATLPQPVQPNGNIHNDFPAIDAELADTLKRLSESAEHLNVCDLRLSALTI